MSSSNTIEEEQTQSETFKRTCSGLRAELRQCLLNSDCVQKERKTPKQCLLEHSPNVDDECYQLKYLFFECKRSLLDARQRFRGRKGY